ncbi:MAG TPA: glycosyl hydrolase [Solirubrobacterales bacterium]|nr:glycosyl hydrolase [Solirubrobacterales bacterium]
MRLRVDTPHLKPALVVALALGVFFGISLPGAASAEGAPAPRVSLSVPAEATRAVPVIARGGVVPPRQGRILLQARKGRTWRPVAAGQVRHGRFRIPFVLRGPTPSVPRLRATLVRGRRSIASSAARRIRLRAANAAPAAPATPVIAVSPAQAVDPAPVATPPPGNAYWGAWIGPQLTGTQAPWDMGAVSKFEQLTGKPLSTIEFSTPFADCSVSPCSYYGFPVDPFNAIRAHGAIPFFSWASQAIPAEGDQSDFQLADILAGTYDAYIHTWAARAAEWGHPFFLRFDWEMNGSWFPWGEGTNGNRPGEYVAAWRHVHDIFTAAGAHNATWVWCPYVNQSDTFAAIYPGDSYVDWTCLDGYNWGLNPAGPHGWSTFESIYGASYATITGALAPSKPMVIAEIGASEYGGSKAAWITDMFEALPTRFPQVRGLLWFENLGNGMDWPLESSESATEAFATGIGDSRYLGNVFGGISASPIPPP